MFKAAITGTGLFTPSQSISNEELVESFNAYVAGFNEKHAEEIAQGKLEPLQESSVAFIEKASGIKSRYVMDKEGILDPERMTPNIPERTNDEQSVLCEMAVKAAKGALEQANKTVKDVDAVLVACSNLQRAYPAISIEVQDALGIEGFGFDMNVACSSATFALQTALDLVKSGTARSVLVLNPEVCTAHLNFRDRDSHFIFGDVCTAILVERHDLMTVDTYYEVLSAKLKTQFSNNIRNNFGFMNRCDPSGIDSPDKLFVQEGRKVFKEVVPMVSEMIVAHLEENGLSADELKRMWLHQANLNMNQLIAKRVLGRAANEEEAPVILDEYANTSSAGSIVAFHKYRSDMAVNDVGVICSFGAGYSVGSVIVQKKQK
jgi:beta-ketodecanoyl-[acyl-carrier-protein] synthase